MADKEKKVKNTPDTPEKSDKKASKKKDNKPKKAKLSERIKASFQKFGSFLKNFKGDIKKIVWPDAKTVWKNTGVVLVCVLIVTVVIFGVDFVLTEILNGVKNLASEAAIQPPIFM